jgi:hypothetical protein
MNGITTEGAAGVKGAAQPRETIKCPGLSAWD